MEFDETPSFWCPHVDRAACNNFSTRTVELRPSERREIHLFFFFSPFLFFFFLSFSTNSFIFLLLSSFFLLPNELFLVPISFLFFLLIFSFSFLSSHFGSSWTGWSREEASSPFPHATCVVLNFPSFFLIPLFPFIASSIMRLIVSVTPRSRESVQYM